MVCAWKVKVCRDWTSTDGAILQQDPFWFLQVVQDNCFAHVHNNRPDGSECAEWALDAIIESFQRCFKSISFKNDAGAWTKHSRDMPMVNRCVVRVDIKYSWRYGVKSMDEYNEGNPNGTATDKGNKKKLSVPSKRESEKKLISEILCKAAVFTETPGQKMELNTLWSVLPQITTQLKKANKDDENEADCNDADTELPEEISLLRMSERIMGDRVNDGVGSAYHNNKSKTVEMKLWCRRERLARLTVTLE